jgi:hypothetical protein
MALQSLIQRRRLWAEDRHKLAEEEIFLLDHARRADDVTERMQDSAKAPAGRGQETWPLSPTLANFRKGMQSIDHIHLAGVQIFPAL